MFYNVSMFMRRNIQHEKEDRVGPRTRQDLPKVWRKYEDRCYAQYLDEAVDDTDKDAEHVYHTLKYQVSMCRQEISLNNDVKSDVQKCHAKVEQLGKLCYAHELPDQAKKYRNEDIEMESYIKTEILREEKMDNLGKWKAWVGRI